MSTSVNYPGKMEAQREYAQQKNGDDLFSYKRMRSVPIRQIVPDEHQKFIRKSFFSDESGLDLRDKYHDDLHAEHVWDQVTAVKNHYDGLKPGINRLKDENRPENDNWHPEDMIKLAYDCGARMAGALIYEDPVFEREMCAIVIAVEMEQEFVKQTPSIPTLQHVFVKYTESMNVVAKMADHMVSQGVYCQPIASVSYFDLNCSEFNLPRMAVEAGLGIMGKHQLLLTPDYGPRVRLAGVFMYKSKYWKDWTPEPESVIQLMQERCDSCTACLKMCPPNALATDNVRACSQYFVEHENCGVCMMVCPLGKVSGRKLYLKKNPTNS